MPNGWTYKKKHFICNVLVNSPEGIYIYIYIYISSMDTFNMSKIVDKVFEMLDAYPEEDWGGNFCANNHK
jgi:hypothetical protein